MAAVLLVDDDKGFCSVTTELLGLLGHEVKTADSVASATELLKESQFDRILLDLMLPDGSGFNVLDTLAKEGLAHTQVTVITGHPAVKNLVKSLYGPRVNYLIKPITLEQLKSLFDDSVVEQTTSRDGIEKHLGFLVGESKVMKDLYEMIVRVASTPANVMIMGESGVGKEVVANAIHHVSKCAGDFVAANCGAFSRELIGSELFGHEKGSFTGAVARKPGVFEQAENGTLFLDEVTEMPVDLQPNLLRVLETQTVVRLGATKPIPINCRVVSATNRTEEQLAEGNCMREDLYYRLAVFPLRIPSLRERKEDVPVLARYFISEMNDSYGTRFALSEELMEQLMAYDWPGNVRELRHTIHRAFIMSDPAGDFLQLPKHLGSPFSKTQKNSEPSLRSGRTIEEVERELIEVTLADLDGDKKQAAQVLGISLKTLYNRLNEYESSE